jgi:hypothetical protein
LCEKDKGAWHSGVGGLPRLERSFSKMMAMAVFMMKVEVELGDVFVKG